MYVCVCVFVCVVRVCLRECVFVHVCDGECVRVCGWVYACERELL